MEIEVVNVKELNYDELVNSKKPIKRDIECGDIILIKEKDSDLWDTQFVTLITNMGIYLHSDSDKLDGGGIIFWPEYIENQILKSKGITPNLDVHKLYDDSKFIHIPIKKEQTK